MPRPPVATRVLSPQDPYDLRATLRPLSRGTTDPTLRFLPSPAGTDRVAATARVPEDSGQGILALIERTGHGPVRVGVWGEPEEAEGFLVRAESFLGLDDDWSAFLDSPAFELLPERVRTGARQRPGLRLAATGQLFHHLVRAVFEQRVTGAEAVGAWQVMVRELGEMPPASPVDAVTNHGLRIPPRPEDWLRVPSWTWREHGVDEDRRRAVQAAAREAARLLRVQESGDVGSLARALSAVPGLGPWTVAETLIPAHGLPDAVSVGDYHLAHQICFALSGQRGDDTRMLELLAPFAGNRQRAIRLLGAHGSAEPRRGPRVAPAPHRYGR